MKTRKILQCVFVALLSISFLFAGNVNAQDEKYGDLERPANVGDSDFDNFKNSSFDVYYNVGKLDVNLKKVETNLISYKENPDNIDFASLRADIKSLNEINAAIPKLQSEVTSLKGKSESMVKGAKDFKPKLKAPKAIKNTNQSVTALDKANDRMKTLVEDQKAALMTAKELLGEEEEE
ncbi:MAG: hypothetical protein P1P88_15395 [Bacteroidales bacterium]|nr:hypothetical protein [Bacteroidales bacterium]